jgi:hypothetical protein
MALERTDVSEELSASFIRVTRIGELGTTLAATSNQRTLRRNTWLSSSEKSVLTRTTGRNIPEDAILLVDRFVFSDNLSRSAKTSVKHLNCDSQLIGQQQSIEKKKLRGP